MNDYELARRVWALLEELQAEFLAPEPNKAPSRLPSVTVGEVRGRLEATSWAKERFGARAGWTEDWTDRLAVAELDELLAAWRRILPDAVAWVEQGGDAYTWRRDKWGWDA